MRVQISVVFVAAVVGTANSLWQQYLRGFTCCQCGFPISNCRQTHTHTLKYICICSLPIARCCMPRFASFNIRWLPQALQVVYSAVGVVLVGGNCSCSPPASVHAAQGCPCENQPQRIYICIICVCVYL